MASPTTAMQMMHSSIFHLNLMIPLAQPVFQTCFRHLCLDEGPSAAQLCKDWALCNPYKPISWPQHHCAARNLGIVFNDQLSFSSLFLILDYCNALMAGLPTSTTKLLHMIQKNSSTSSLLSAKEKPCQTFLISLHWLPVMARIKCTFLMLAFRTTGTAHPYLNSLLQMCALVTEKVMHCCSFTAEKKTLSKTFALSVPHWWNELSTSIWTDKSITSFKRQLKTHLFCKHLSTPLSKNNALTHKNSSLHFSSYLAWFLIWCLINLALCITTVVDSLTNCFVPLLYIALDKSICQIDKWKWKYYFLFIEWLLFFLARSYSELWQNKCQHSKYAEASGL